MCQSHIKSYCILSDFFEQVLCPCEIENTGNRRILQDTHIISIKRHFYSANTDEKVTLKGVRFQSTIHSPLRDEFVRDSSQNLPGRPSVRLKTVSRTTWSSEYQAFLNMLPKLARNTAMSRVGVIRVLE